MKEDIKHNLGKPRQLEALYRENKVSFKKEFNQIYPEIQDHHTAQVWNARLNFKSEGISWSSRKEIVFVLIASFIAGLIVKIPDLTGIDPEYFYPRNVAFVVFPVLSFYFACKHSLPIKRIAITSAAFIISAIYINLLPDNTESDTLILACIHLPLFLWAILGTSFLGGKLNNQKKRLDFLIYNGDLLVMSALLVIAGGLFTAITLGLFELIDLRIEDFYFPNIALWGVAAIPVVGTYLIQANPHLVGKVSPVIAKIFTPIVLVTLTIYLIALIYTDKSPYNNREFLLIFNVLLIAVMAIILFSIAETSNISAGKFKSSVLFGLSVVTIILNGIALSAILFRISEWGFTPNRLAVLGANILILTNLLLVSIDLYKMLINKGRVEKVERSITSFLPVYIIWITIVTFIFPMLFGFK
ncbi:MAG: hypothetical protein WD357_07665 [Gracilimonas sp.]